MTSITPTRHEKSEWSRFAVACYNAGRNDLGHFASMRCAALREGQSMPVDVYDRIAGLYRDWLVFGTMPE